MYANSFSTCNITEDTRTIKEIQYCVCRFIGKSALYLQAIADKSSEY